MINPRWAGVLLLAGLTSACVTAPPRFDVPGSGPITVFVPGYEGTVLRTADGTIAWLTPGVALSRGDTSLAFEFEGQRPFKRFGKLTPGEPITRLRVIPWVIDVALYAPWLEFAKTSIPGFVPFGYDWRVDIREAAKQLEAKLRSLPVDSSISIVAHSMGGLVTLTCLRTAAPDVVARIKKVVFVGSPFGGAPTAYDDLHLGTQIGRNRALLSAEALLTISSVFQLAPRDPDYFVGASGSPESMPDAYSPQQWIAKGWGLFAEAPVRDSPGYQAQLAARWREHAELWALLGDRPDDPRIPSLVVVGKGRETVNGFRRSGDGFDFQHPVQADGDGSVVASRAIPPAPFQPTVVETKAAHVLLLNDDQVQDAIAAFLAAP